MNVFGLDEPSLACSVRGGCVFSKRQEDAQGSYVVRGGVGLERRSVVDSGSEFGAEGGVGSNAGDGVEFAVRTHDLGLESVH